MNNSYVNKRVKLGNKEAKELTLAPYQKTLLVGTLLGDGSLKAPTGNFENCRFQMKHSEKQLDWILWKAKQLDSITGKTPFHSQPETIQILNQTTGKITTTGNLYRKIHFQSRALPCLTELHRETYTDNVLDFSKPWLYNYVTEEALMVWWLDDGGLIGEGGRKGKLATHGFAKSSLPYLQRLLLDKWDIRSTVQSNTYNNQTYYYLQFSPEMLKRLLRVIMRYIPIDSMIYKASLKYKNPILQKHWISIMYDEIRPSFHSKLESLVGPRPDKVSLAKEILGRSRTDSFEVNYPFDALALEKAGDSPENQGAVDLDTLLSLEE